ncbi:hypothetical protein FRC07_001552 [Ceratobasidium sp. 392]|nr:hypothetical protein FRC07_001552 [Ceratobasidium sp. 392]
MVAGTTRFTRRTGNYTFPKPTPTNGYTSLVNGWHHNVFDQQDVEYQLAKAGTEHAPIWEAIPTIMGEKHPQFKGTGPSIPKAKADSAYKIATSGHC